ncbi:MAG: hypothetical protein K2X03_23770 [Bryobacteraceae bacterium]|nr:hypothetical protein [Bryobacteraceae bacterium]
MILLSLLLLAQDPGLRVGAAQVDITPPVGMPLAGYYSTRLATGMHDPLQAKAIVLEQAGQTVALVACDLTNLPPEVIEQAEALIGWPAGHVMISATHSHTGPVLSTNSSRNSAYGGDLPVVAGYMRELPKRIAAAVAQARAAVVPATVSWGTGQEGSLVFNRRFHMRDGSVGWNPGKLNPGIVKPAGPVDPDVNVVVFGTPAIATYVNYALHLDTVGGTEFSADYPYALSEVLGKVQGSSMVTLFTMGTSGNVNHIDVSHREPQKGHGEAARIGTVLAGEVIKTFTRLRPAKGLLRTSTAQVELDLASITADELAQAKKIAAQVRAGENPKFLDTVAAFKTLDVAERAGRSWSAEVQVIALGQDLAWVALPGEIFVELGQRIKQASPFAHTIVVELAHGPVTYFPNEAAFPQGNYEVVTSRAARGSGERLVESAIAQLKSLYAR